MAEPFIFTGEHFNVQDWIATVDEFFTVHAVPEQLQLAFARSRVEPRVDACVQSLTSPLERVTEGEWNWTWPKYRTALREIQEQVKRGGITGEDVALKVAIIAAAGVTACVAGPLVLAAGLGAVGFSSAGVVAGSFAAGIQSTVYGASVASGSIFAICQSFAMGGAATVAAVTGVSGAAGITAATIKEIASKSPSKSWDDAGEFQPSETLLRALLSLHVDPDDYDDDLPMLINPHPLSIKDE